MTTQLKAEIRFATSAEDAVIAAHFYQMWRDNDIPTEAIASNWQAEVQGYLDDARRSLNYQSFVAEVNHQVIGSVGCQRFAGLYPNILKASYRQDGYIWGVYVEPDFRRHGVATQLTNQAIVYLQSIGCTHAVLNASPSGRPVYSRLGFTDSNVMRRSLP
jgi:ribosomal protein S18 acetylase RimI-like enzyme